MLLILFSSVSAWCLPLCLVICPENLAFVTSEGIFSLACPIWRVHLPGCNWVFQADVSRKTEAHDRGVTSFVFMSDSAKLSRQLSVSIHFSPKDGKLRAPQFFFSASSRMHMHRAGS